MRFPLTRFLALLLVLAALLGGSACSLRGSKISNSDIDKLNSANARIQGMSAEYQAGILQCASATVKKTCILKLYSKLAGDVQSAADTYEQVANGVHGDCQAAIRAAGEHFHSAALALKQGRAPNLSYKRMKADNEKVRLACTLKRASQ
jgi:hypothetical protein